MSGRRGACYSGPGTAVPHVNPLIGASAGMPTYGTEGLRAPVAEGESARLASAARPVCLIRPVPTLVDGKL